jgi:hypothetical protein
VGGGFGPLITALAGSLMVHVVPLMTRDSPWNAASPVPCTSRSRNAFTRISSSCAASWTWDAVPLPRHSTGSATGEGQHGSSTTIAAMTQVFPNAIFFPPCAEPSYAHRASATRFPHLLKKVPSTATISGSPSLSRYFTISRVTAIPSASGSRFAAAKNQHARRHRCAIPAAAAIPVTVPRSARISPHASAMNRRYVERRANTGASSSSRSRHCAGMGSLSGSSISGHSGQTVA